MGGGALLSYAGTHRNTHRNTLSRIYSRTEVRKHHLNFRLAFIPTAWLSEKRHCSRICRGCPKHEAYL